MVTVKIPDNAHPWRCNINGVEYCYEAGSTQSVPDEVAQLIHDIEAAAKKPAPVDPPFPVPEGGGSLPEYGESDAGKVLSVNEDGDGVEWAEAGGGGGGVLVVEDDGSGTLNKTWKEIHDAALQMIVIFKAVDGDTTYINYLYTVGVDQGEYAVGFLADGMVVYFLTDNENGYPVFQAGD